MNYLELINKCLTELNYKNVNAFSELVKNEHKKIKNILNVINFDICTSHDWNFLIKQTTVNLPQGYGDVDNPLNGKIKYLVIDNKIYDYNPNFEEFFTNSQKNCTYSICNNKILLPQFDEAKIVAVTYYTHDCALDKDENLKSEMIDETDTTIIPAHFAEPLLVYGTCMRLKGNPQHIRFNYWYSMYKDALANLVAYSSPTVDDNPHVTLRRE